MHDGCNLKTQLKNTIVLHAFHFLPTITKTTLYTVVEQEQEQQLFKHERPTIAAMYETKPNQYNPTNTNKITLC